MTWLFCNLQSKPLTRSEHPLAIAQPWRPRQRPTWLKSSNLACASPPRKSLNFFAIAKSGFELTYLQALLRNAEDNVGPARSTLVLAFPGNATKKIITQITRKRPRKKSGICRPGRGFWAKFWPRPDFQVGPKPSKMEHNGSRIDGSA